MSMITRGPRRSSGAGPTLLVASTGGHLEELVRLRNRLDPLVGECEWVTFDDPQSRSLLSGETVHYIDYIAPRGYSSLLRGMVRARSILRRGGYSRVISTGAGIAIPFLAVGRSMGISGHYIESAARAVGPSLTGSVVSHVPGVQLYTQYQGWASDSWHYSGSLFDGYGLAGPDDLVVAPTIEKVVVTLGTMRTYGFRRAVERISELLPEVAPGAEVLWQTGVTDLTGLDVEGRDLVPAGEMNEAIAGADLVIAHAGIGSALNALDTGHCPVLLPRLREHGEHVDDHQLLIAGELDSRGIALGRDATALTADDLRLAAAAGIQRATERRPFRLAA